MSDPAPTPAPTPQPAPPADPPESLLGGDPLAPPAPGPSDPPAPLERPDWLPEKFWTDKGANVEALAKSYDVAQKALGRKAQAIYPINDKSTPEEIAEFRKALGVPEKPEDYALKPETLPEGVTFDEESAKAVAALAHKHNIPASAMREIVAWDLQRQQQAQQAAVSILAKQHEEGKTELKNTFGEELDNSLELARRAVATVGGKADARGFSDPEVVKVIVRLAGKISDDQLVSAQSTGAVSNKSRAKDIMTNPENPLYQRYQNGDPEVVEQVRGMLR